MSHSSPWINPGVSWLILVTGDNPQTAKRIAAELGIDRVYAGLSPEDKMAFVAENSGGPGALIMLGDGVNDAPALALADVGIAMGGRGSAASAQSADMVVLEDRLERIPRVVRIAKGTMKIARQSVRWGMLLSLVAMGMAALGYLPPPLGALMQEGIDVAVILNALRALTL